MTKFTKFLGFLLLLFIGVFAVGCDDNKVDDGEDPEDTTPIPLDTSLTDEFRLTENLDGKDFIRDGVGIVKLNRVIDGDTITVQTSIGSVSIRFHGVNTPESTGKVEAWGKAASAFAKEVLKDAEIALVAEGERMDNNGRYLAWVWYKPQGAEEYRLLQLEEIELAYSKYLIDSTHQYFQVLYNANDKAKKSKRRVWGEKDPNFNYSREVVETSLLYMLTNPDEFTAGTKVVINIRLVRTVGTSMFVEDAYEVSFDQDGEIVSGKGAAYGFTYKDYARNYKIGDVFTLQCQFQYKGDFGTQLTDLDKPGRVTENAAPEILELNADNLNGGADLEAYYGQVVKLKNLQVSSVKKTQQGNDKPYYTVRMKNSKGDDFDIYFSDSLIRQHDVEEIFKVGDKFDIIGGVAYYEFARGEYQLSMGDAVRYTQGVIHPDDLLRKDDVVKVN